MKKLISVCVLFFVSSLSFAQSQNPVNWICSYKALSANEGEIVITALIDKTWHTYSQVVTPDGPIPTTFSFSPTKHYSLVGKTTESKPEEEFVEAFGAKVLQFSDKAQFTQKIKINSSGPLVVSFKVEYICCDNKMCLPPKTIDLNVKVQ